MYLRFVVDRRCDRCSDEHVVLGAGMVLLRYHPVVASQQRLFQHGLLLLLLLLSSLDDDHRLLLLLRGLRFIAAALVATHNHEHEHDNANDGDVSRVHGAAIAQVVISTAALCVARSAAILDWHTI